MTSKFGTIYNVYWRETPSSNPMFIPGASRVNFSNSGIGFDRGEFGIDFLPNTPLPKFGEGNVFHIEEEKNGLAKVVFTGVINRAAAECITTDGNCTFIEHEIYTIGGVELTYYMLEMVEHAYPQKAAESDLNLDGAEFVDRVIQLNLIAPTAARYAPFAHTFPVTSSFTATGAAFANDIGEQRVIDIIEDVVGMMVASGVMLCVTCDVPNALDPAPMQVNFTTRPSTVKPVYLSKSNGTISAQIDEDAYIDAYHRVFALGVGEDDNRRVQVNEFLDVGNSLKHREIIVNGNSDDTDQQLQDTAKANIGTHVPRSYNFITLNKNGLNEVYDTWGPCDLVRLETCHRGDVLAWISGIFIDWSLDNGIPDIDVELCTVADL